MLAPWFAYKCLCMCIVFYFSTVNKIHANVLKIIR